MNTPGGIPHNGVGPVGVDPESPETAQKRALDIEQAETMAKAYLNEALVQLRGIEALTAIRPSVADLHSRWSAQDAIRLAESALRCITRF
jgi:hypothetical protein